MLEGEGFRSGIDFYFEHGLVVKDSPTGVSIVRALNNSSHIRTKAGLKQSGGTWVVTFGEDDEDAHGLKTTIEFLESVRTELWGGKAKAHLEQVARFSNIPEAKKFAQAKSDMLHEMQRAIQDFVEDLKRRHS